MDARANNPKPRRRLVLAALLPCLFLAFTFWYIIKLSHTYTASVPVTLRVEGTRLRVDPMVEATGYRLFLYRYITRSRLEASLEQLGAVPSAITEGNWVVDPLTLQNFISVNNSDLRIVAMGEVPELAIAVEPLDEAESLEATP